MIGPVSSAAPEKLRDAERSRGAILDAAERLFAERGFDAASLNEIGAAAGLSRGTPSYFFGAKEQLYVAVLERVFAARQEATAAAFEPVHAWCADDTADLAALRDALVASMEGYLGFLLARPAFARLLTREELGGARRLQEVPRASTAMNDAFGALRRLAPARGLRAFDVGDGVLLYVGLTFAPVAHQSTFMAALGRDLAQPAVRRRHVAFAADQLMALVSAT